MSIKDKPSIVYWMSRDQRALDNPALNRGKYLCKKLGASLGVVFCFQQNFLNCNHRHTMWMLEGLKELSQELDNQKIPFFLLHGLPHEVLPEFLQKVGCLKVVTDFSPLKIKKQWLKCLKNKIRIPLEVIDAHNLIPVEKVSRKQEFAAYTIRPKIYKLLPEFLKEPENLIFQNSEFPFKAPKVRWSELIKSNHNYFLKPGTKAGLDVLQNFVSQRLVSYGSLRNDPNYKAQSNLSPYLHFGQVSALRIAWEVSKKATLFPFLKDNTNYAGKNVSQDLKNKEFSVLAFLEELIVRRELSENFCFYNENYDNFQGFPDWAKQTLINHQQDKREIIYDLKQLETGTTNDPLWNACQQDMVITGKMPGYLRMYWAKQLLLWTETPQKAMEVGVYLNDRYSLDGRDPNGYTGLAWSIGGLHDRPWFEREIFGKVRFMNYSGSSKKFDVKKYIQSVDKLK